MPSLAKGSNFVAKLDSAGDHTDELIDLFMYFWPQTVYVFLIIDLVLSTNTHFGKTCVM